MKKKLLLILLALVLMGSLSIPGTVTAAPKPVKLKMSSFVPAKFVPSVTTNWYCKEITRRTNGRVQWDMYWGGSLLKGDQLLAGISKGICDFASYISLGYTPKAMPLYWVGMQLFVTDKIDERLQIGQKAGAAYAGNVDKTNVVKEILELEPRGLDVVFECCGQQEAVDQAFDLLKPGGVLMLIGIPEFDRWSFPVDKMRHKEICVQNVRRQNGTLEETLELLENNKVDVTPMATHRFSFDDTQKAFNLVAGYKDGVMKAMIDF